MILLCTMIVFSFEVYVFVCCGIWLCSTGCESRDANTKLALKELRGTQGKETSWPKKTENMQIFSLAGAAYSSINVYAMVVLFFFFFLVFEFEVLRVQPWRFALYQQRAETGLLHFCNTCGPSSWHHSLGQNDCIHNYVCVCVSTFKHWHLNKLDHKLTENLLWMYFKIPFLRTEPVRHVCFGFPIAREISVRKEWMLRCELLCLNHCMPPNLQRKSLCSM